MAHHANRYPRVIQGMTMEDATVSADGGVIQAECSVTEELHIYAQRPSRD
jgi:putative (di)nucleoside polyphosphate hydrolase